MIPISLLLCLNIDLQLMNGSLNISSNSERTTIQRDLLAQREETLKIIGMQGISVPARQKRQLTHLKSGLFSRGPILSTIVSHSLLNLTVSFGFSTYLCRIKVQIK